MDLYDQYKLLSPQELIQKIKEAKDEDERIFYAALANMELQKRHKKVVEKNIF